MNCPACKRPVDPLILQHEMRLNDVVDTATVLLRTFIRDSLNHEAFASGQSVEERAIQHTADCGDEIRAYLEGFHNRNAKLERALLSLKFQLESFASAIGKEVQS